MGQRVAPMVVIDPSDGIVFLWYGVGVDFVPDFPGQIEEGEAPLASCLEIPKKPSEKLLYASSLLDCRSLPTHLETDWFSSGRDTVLCHR